MTAIEFLVEWTVRSAILVLTGVLLLRVFRVKDPSIVLAVWTAALCGSLALPALHSILPNMAVTVAHAPALNLDLPEGAAGKTAAPHPAGASGHVADTG